MSAPRFVHLRLHTEYSVVDGMARVDDAVAAAAADGMPALAITDHGNLHGALEFYRECKSKGINPIIGYEAYIAPDSRFKSTNAERSGANSATPVGLGSAPVKAQCFKVSSIAGFKESRSSP